MFVRKFTGAAVAVLGVLFTSTAAFSQTPEATSEGPAANGSPAWHLQGVNPDASGRGVRRGPVAGAGPATPARPAAQANSAGAGRCEHTTVCDPPKDFGGNRLILKGVVWDTMKGWTVAYPDVSPEGEDAGMTAVAVDSKDNLWGIQRNAVGRPQLFKWSPDHKLLLSIGDDVITHQGKAHGIAVDSHDNIWICDAGGATVKELSPDGKLLKTIGVREHPGDWDEAKGQRLLWQPLMIAFASNGDMYIGEGHAEESPNDVGSNDPTNNNGSARVIRLDKDGNFIQQWYGDQVGQGKFSMAHGFAVDPKNGDVYVGDREQYRYVVFTSDGKFIRTVQMRNLVCSMYFDKQDNLWIGTGWDGQVIKVAKTTGKVLGALGNGNGEGVGQFLEAPYLTMDSHGNMYVGDTTRGRITEFVAPKHPV